MTTTCQASTLYSWWSVNKWITNNKRTNQLKQFTVQSKQHNLKLNHHFNQLRSFSTIFLFIILVFNLIQTISTDNQFRAPVIIEQPVDVTVRRNDPATLNCKTEGNPPPTVEWIKDGIKIRASKNPMILPSGSLFFFQVDQVRI